MKSLTHFSIVLLLFFSSCKGEWQKEDKEKIKADCMLAAEKYGFTDPKNHCDCVLEKIITRYPDPNQFENMQMGEFGEIVNECQGKRSGTREIWPIETRKAFVDSCSSMARQQGKAEPKKYCTCVLEELINRYPTNDSIEGITKAELLEIGKRCY